MNFDNKLTEAVNQLKPLRVALLSLRPEMIISAQKVYDSWDEEEPGGICDEIANEIGGIIAQNIANIELDEYGHDGDDHAAVIASLGDEKYVVDISAHLYETGGGYSWDKIPGVLFGIDDVMIIPL